MILQRIPKWRVAVLAALLLVVGASLVWYQAPVRIESINSLAYCACGYSTVSFHDGQITMVRYHHDTVKPGQRIGTYRIVDEGVELDILFNGKLRKDTFAIDNIGILASKPVLLRYYALNDRSPKTYVHLVLQRLNSSLKSL